MFKVKLRYTDCLQEGKNVFSILASNEVVILKTKHTWYSTKVIITCLFNDAQIMQDVLYELNNWCSYEVAVVKCKLLKEKK